MLRFNIAIFSFIFLIIAISILFELIRRDMVKLGYYEKMMKKDDKPTLATTTKSNKEESGYLFLNGSYFMKYPYVDSYPQY